jgi:hypothetical protein
MRDTSGEGDTKTFGKAFRKRDDAYVATLRAAGGFGAPLVEAEPGAAEPEPANAVRWGGAGPVKDQPALQREPLRMTLPAEIKRRPVKAANIMGVEPSTVHGARPVFEWVSPEQLLVDETYQRGLSEKSLWLIRRIVGAWDWKRFKPPVVARTADGFDVIDGQHTAIAAASHPDITEIPVMVVEAIDQASRAQAFIGHNRDRLGMTPMQIHFAAAAGGDEDALTIDQVCGRAGVRILRHPPAGGAYKPGDTVAIKAIGALINRRGVISARQVLQTIAEGKCAPVSMAAIRAVEMLMFDKEYAGDVDASAITTALIALGTEADREAQVFSSAHKVPLWRALGVVLFRRAKRGRRRTA